MHDIVWKIPSTSTIAAPSDHWQQSRDTERPAISRRPRLDTSFAALGVHQFATPRLQAKLTVSQPNDSAEVEADAVADQVVQMPEPQTALARRAADGIGIQRKCEDCQEEAARQVEESDDEQISRMPEDDDKEMVSAKAEEEEAARMAADEEEVTRMATDEEEVTRMAMDEDDTVSAKAETGAQSRVSSGVESQVRTLNSAGAPLSDETRKFFEPRFGADFSGVRIHNGSQAAGVARQLNARAFTVGNHITFGAGQYSPSSSDGRRLIAHELTHVLQQRGQSPKTRS